MNILPWMKALFIYLFLSIFFFLLDIYQSHKVKCSFVFPETGDLKSLAFE